MSILTIVSKNLSGKPSKITKLQPEGAARITVAAGGLCYSLLGPWVHKCSKNL